MLIFQHRGKKYKGASALDIVKGLEADATNYPHPGQSVRTFLQWSLAHQCDAVPPRDLDLSDSLDDDVLALSYLYLRDEYGAGRFLAARDGS
jgi:hypothetical protein